MLKRGMLFSLVVLVMIAPIAMVAAQGGAIKVGDTIEGELTGTAANYTVTLAAGQAVSVTLSSDAFDSYLVVQDSSGAGLAEDDDSGGNLNSALLFVAPSDGEYTIVVDSLSGGGEGAFTLVVEASELVEVEVNSTTEVMMESSMQTFSFAANEGDVVNIYGDNPDVDVRLTLVAPDGIEVLSDDDSGPGYAPYIRRALLPATGTYTLRMEPVFDDATGPIMLTLETTEELALDDGPQTVTLGDDLGVERLTFAATAGESYRITVSADAVTSAYITLDQGDFNFYSLSFNDALEASAVFLPQQTGSIAIEIDDNSYDSMTTYTITMEPAG